jgi:hypothetical protein
VGSFCRTRSGEYRRAFPAIHTMKTVICTTKRNDCMNVMYSLTTAARFARIWRSDLVYNHRAGNTISTQTRGQEATAHDLPPIHSLVSVLIGIMAKYVMMKCRTGNPFFDLHYHLPRHRTIVFPSPFLVLPVDPLSGSSLSSSSPFLFAGDSQSSFQQILPLAHPQTTNPKSPSPCLSR